MALSWSGVPKTAPLQMLSFRAFTQYAFTILVAGLAFTLIVLPKAVEVPAFLAGLIFVFSMHSPGMVNFPVFFTSAVASCTKLSTTPATDFLSRPVLSTKADVIPLFGMAVTAFFFITFIAFTIAEEEGVLKY